MRASSADLLKLARAGYRVERHGDLGWVLLDPDGASLQIAGWGGVAPTQWEAVAEGLHRLELEHA